MSLAAPPAVDPLSPPPETSASRRARSALLGRIRRRYQVAIEPRAVGAWSLAFTRIADPDTVLDEVVEECDRIERDTGVRLSDPLHLPYWAELWDSAAGVGGALVERALAAGASDPSRTSRDREGAVPPQSPPIEGRPLPHGRGSRDAPAEIASALALRSPPARPNVYDLPGRPVLDLGCGMGLTGTVCAALGANVLMADLETAPLLFARLNSLPWRKRVRTRQLNWQTDRLGERFDLIVGADILYERSQWEFLDAFWQHHLAPGGELVLGEPGRGTGDAFLDWAPARGWALHRADRKVPTRETPVRVLTLRRKDEG